MATVRRQQAAAGLPNGRLRSIDMLRGVAALAVVLVHVPHLSQLVPAHRSGWLFLPLDGGGRGVILFLVISGFCIHLAVARKLAEGQGMACRWGEFWRRRFVRLYPPYVAAILLSLVALHPRLTNDQLWNGYRMGAVSLKRDLASHLLMVHNLFPRYILGLGNPVFWTLGLEEQLYVLYAFFLLLRMRLSAVRACLATGAVSFVWYVASVLCPLALHRAWAGWPTWPFGPWIVWTLGALSAEACVGSVRLPRWCASARIGWICAITGACLYPPVLLAAGLPRRLASLPAVGALLGPWAGDYWAVYRLGDYAFALAFFILINRWTTAERAGAFQSRSADCLRRIGVMSYSLYLTHIPVIRTTESAFHHLRFPDNIATTVFRYVLYVPLCLLIAWTFYQAIERWFAVTRRRPTDAPGSEAEPCRTQSVKSAA